MKILGEVSVKVVVEPPAPFFFHERSPEEQEKVMLDEARSLEQSIKRHCDADSVGVEIDRTYACSHCGHAWNEDSDDFNGGCCHGDYQDAPWKEYADSGESCPTCSLPPFRFFEHDGYLFFDCKCGEQWERKQ